MALYLIKSSSNWGKTWELTINDLQSYSEAVWVCKSLMMGKWAFKFLFRIEEYNRD